jgi:hypothetical protein
MNEINKYKNELLLDIFIIILSILLWILMFFVHTPSLIVITFFLSSIFLGGGIICFIIDAVKLNELLNYDRR